MRIVYFAILGLCVVAMFVQGWRNHVDNLIREDISRLTENCKIVSETSDDITFKCPNGQVTVEKPDADKG